MTAPVWFAFRDSLGRNVHLNLRAVQAVSLDALDVINSGVAVELAGGVAYNLARDEWPRIVKCLDALEFPLPQPAEPQQDLLVDERTQQPKPNALADAVTRLRLFLDVYTGHRPRATKIHEVNDALGGTALTVADLERAVKTLEEFL